MVNILPKEESKKMSVQSNEWPSFGALLKTLRTRRHLTQQQLANVIGVHRHAIGRWEQGDVLPASKAIVLELARHLHLDDSEARQLLEASLTALAPPSTIPYPRNPLFTGREELLATLHQCLAADRAVFSRSYAIHGLGGMGKTHLALEYAYQHRLEYTAVFWVSAESGETIFTSFMAIAEVLQLPQREETDRQQVFSAVQHWLSTHGKWLLVWDNLEDLEMLQRSLPSSHQGTILITTRRQALGTVAQGIELPPMGEQEGILFLLRRARQLDPTTFVKQLALFAQRTPAEYAAARELVATMGGVPLALDQVGAYAEETPCSLVEYLELYRTRHAELLKRRGEVVIDHLESVVTTWFISFEKVEHANAMAADLLRWCAFLHPDAIAEEIFLLRSTSQDEQSDPVVVDAFELHRAIRAASAYSLLKRNVQEHTLSIHRLVQVVLREGMSEQERGQWQRRVIRRLNALFPAEAIHETWRQCERLLPHVLTCASALPDLVEDQELANVLRKAADYLHERVQYKEAEPLYRRALRIRQQALGPEHPDSARPLYGLAYLYYEQGKYEEAEPLYQRALHIWEQALGPEHPDVAHSLNRLANLYIKQGKHEEAKPLYQRSLHIWEQALGLEHPNAARLLNNLALIYYEQGKYEEAEPLYQRSLHIWEQALGLEHPDVAYPLNNLATLYEMSGKYEEAEPLYQRALRIWEQALGPEHPNVACALYGLAYLYCEQGKYKQAEPLYQRTLCIWEQALGSEHPDMAHSLNGLAVLYGEQGKYAEAESLYQRALAIREQHLGQEHPDTARSLADLARLYGKRGDDEQAMSLLQRACRIFEQRLGQAHPETVKARRDYHNLQDLRKRTMNISLYESKRA